MKILFLCLAFLLSQIAWAGNVNVYSYLSGPVSNNAYTLIWNSTPIATSHLEICDSSGQFVSIAVTVNGSKKDLFSTPVNGCIVVPFYLASGTQVWLKALGSTAASSGYNVISITGY